MESDAAETLLVEYLKGRAAGHWIRKGQALMNALYVVDQVEYRKMTWHKDDPFYNDAKLAAAVKRLFVNESEAEAFLKRLV